MAIHSSVTNATELIRLHGARLRSLVGGTLEETWVVWDVEANTYFGDAPVVLRIDGTHLSVECRYLNEIRISWSAPDFTKPPFDLDELGIRLEWRRNALPQLAEVVGFVVQSISVTEYCPATINRSEKGQHAVGLLHGVLFNFGGNNQLEIFNALDETGISRDLTMGEDVRRLEL